MGRRKSLPYRAGEWRAQPQTRRTQIGQVTQRMTRIELAPEVFDDFDRFFEHIAQFDAGSAPQRIGDILEAIQILTHSPQIGRPVKDGKRELVIGRATRGYVALYRYVAAIDTVFVLAVRAQREDRFKREIGL
jgi:plasmid stabilization system protein ParE